MAPPSGLARSAIPSDFDNDSINSAGEHHQHTFPPLTRSSTVPANLQSPTRRADPSHLAPEDAFLAASPPRRTNGFDTVRGLGGGHGSSSDIRQRRPRRKDGTSRSRSRRRKRFQKLLWVKQSYPDNYTDQATFLENLQRNPRLQPYEFWPLIADSTVIVQHVCSVIIFLVCFIGIFQERVSPVSVVSWGSFATFLGWLVCDWWIGKENEEAGVGDGLVRTRSMGGGRAYREFRPPRRQDSGLGVAPPNASTTSISSVSNLPSAASSTTNLALAMQEAQCGPHPQRPPLAAYGGSSNHNLGLPKHAHSTSASSLHSATSQTSASRTGVGNGIGISNGYYSTAHPDAARPDTSPEPTHRIAAEPPLSRSTLRLGTIKSAVLIYFTLLGLSPILKSLTRSTSSDSIWAMSFWLLAINVFFFDYSGAWPGASRFPVASLSTNAALMASTVLASRLPSTGQVFSLTLFSIEVFGLFPVFRRYARHRSWRYHVALTALLVLGAGAGVGMVMGGADDGDTQGWPWRRGLLGMLVGCLMAALSMGGCSWWLIGLQKYKNEIYGPWDPARPIIISRRHWDDG